MFRKLTIVFSTFVMFLSMFANAAPVAAGGGSSAPPPPSGFCLNPYGSNVGWSIGAGQSAWNACTGKTGAWMFQVNGTGDPMGHQRHMSLKQLETWRQNHGYPAGTYWFDRYMVPSGACHSGSTVSIHLPTGVYPSAPCGAKSIYQLNIRGHTYQGTWAHIEFIRKCKFHGYEGTIWVIKVVYKHHGCGCS